MRLCSPLVSPSDSNQPFRFARYFQSELGRKNGKIDNLKLALTIRTVGFNPFLATTPMDFPIRPGTWREKIRSGSPMGDIEKGQFFSISSGEKQMWRSFFLAIGIFAIVLGVESLVVDQVIFDSNRPIPALVAGKTGGGNGNPFSGLTQTPFQNAGFGSSTPTLNGGDGKAFKTRDWMPWSLLAFGAITVMYTISLPPAPSRPKSKSDD